MKYFKSPSGELFAYESDGSQDDYIPADYIAISEVEKDAILNPPPSLDEVKERKRVEIRSAHEADAQTPVLHAGVEWSGGFDSAIKLDAAKRLAETAGLPEVTFYDTANVGHALSFADATAVVMAVSVAYQTSLSKKQSLMVQVSTAATVAEVEAIIW